MSMFFTYISSQVALLSTNFSAISTGCDPNKTFFGLPVWYKYLVKNTTAGACDFRNLKVWPPDNLILVAVAILDALLRLAGILAVGFIIWGGISYVLSQGEPDKTKEAQQTVINALIGLIVTLIAVALISFLGAKLGG